MSKVATVSNVNAVTSVEVTGLPKAKPLALAAVKAAFPQCYIKDVAIAIKAIGNKAKGLKDVIDIYMGYALHKAHSGMGFSDAIALKMGSCIELKGDKSPTARTAQWAQCMGIVMAVPCKSLKDATDISSYEELAISVKEELTELLIDGPARELADKRLKKATSDTTGTDTTTDTATATATATGTTTKTTFDSCMASIEDFSPAQLAKLQAAIAAQLAKVPPM